MLGSRGVGAVILGVALLVLSAPASAAPILLTSNGGLSQVQFYEPIGQVFTAEDPYVQAGLSFDDINPSFANDDAIQYQLFAGSGVGGALLASSSFNLANDFSGFHLVDFSSVALTVGNQYTLVASILGDSPYWAIHLSSTAYAGGTAVFQGAVHGTAINALSVVPVDVPEPVTFALLGLGGAALVVRRRFTRLRQ